jgi:hypothetical protein
MQQNAHETRNSYGAYSPEITFRVPGLGWDFFNTHPLFVYQAASSVNPYIALARHHEDFSGSRSSSVRKRNRFR